MGRQKWTTSEQHRCHCCDRQAHRLSPLVWTDKGWTCSSDRFCLAGTSMQHRAEPEPSHWAVARSAGL